MDLELSTTNSALVVAGLGVAAFVGFNIGGSSTGVAFGPAVGSRIVLLWVLSPSLSAVGSYLLFAVVPRVGG